MNVVDLGARRMANIEVWEDRHSVFEVTENYTHFNEYKHLKKANGKRINDKQVFENDYRQRRADQYSAPVSKGDVQAILGDPAIFRQDETIATLVLDGVAGLLDVWVNQPASGIEAPVYRFDLLNFWDRSRQQW